MAQTPSQSPAEAPIPFEKPFAQYRRGKQLGQGVAEEVVWVSRGLQCLLLVVTFWIAFPGYVFLHYRLGERFVTLLNLIIAFHVAIFASMLLVGLMDSPSIASPILLLAFMIVGGIQYARMLSRRLRGIESYSYSKGLIWPVWTSRLHITRPWLVTDVLEPAAVAGLGILLAVLNDPFGGYLIAVGLSMAAQETLARNHARRQQLDLIDQRLIEKQWSQAAGQRQSPLPTEGVATHELP